MEGQSSIPTSKQVKELIHDIDPYGTLEIEEYVIPGTKSISAPYLNETFEYPFDLFHDESILSDRFRLEKFLIEREIPFSLKIITPDHHLVDTDLSVSEIADDAEVIFCGQFPTQFQIWLNIRTDGLNIDYQVDIGGLSITSCPFPRTKNVYGNFGEQLFLKEGQTVNEALRSLEDEGVEFHMDDFRFSFFDSSGSKIFQFTNFGVGGLAWLRNRVKNRQDALEMIKKSFVVQIFS